jgi:hypothetical protein
MTVFANQVARLLQLQVGQFRSVYDMCRIWADLSWEACPSDAVCVMETCKAMRSSFQEIGVRYPFDMVPPGEDIVCKIGICGANFVQPGCSDFNSAILREDALPSQRYEASWSRCIRWYHAPSTPLIRDTFMVSDIREGDLPSPAGEAMGEAEPSFE